jgi:spermidine synthase
MFGIKELEIVNSKHSGKMVVKKDGRDVYVTTGGLTQSGGELIKEVWNTFLSKNWWWKMRNKDWLILGLATGTVTKMISDKYQPKRIVGVEIDPEMVRLGHKYFGLDKIPKLEIVNQDAKLYVEKSRDLFDFILVDMYLGDKLPTFVYTDKFLKKIQNMTVETAVFNHLAYDTEKRSKAEKLVTALSHVFVNVQLRRVLTNVLVICKNSDK